MSNNKKYFWLKLKNDFFDQKEIKMLRRLAGGDTFTVIYLKILLLSLKNDGRIYYDGVANSMVDEIALEIDEDIENTQVTFNYLQQKGMIMFNADDEIEISNIASLVGSESDSARRVRKHRERKALQCNGEVTHEKRLGNTEIEIEIDKELDKEIDIDKDIKSKELSSVADAPTTSPPSKPKKVKQVKHKHGEYDNVLLTDAEFETLKAELGDDLNYWIEKVSGYMAGNGNKNHYKNFLAVIRNWSKNGKDKARQQYQYQNSRPSPKLPDWVGKEFEETESTPEEIAEMQAQIDRLKKSRIGDD